MACAGGTADAGASADGEQIVARQGEAIDGVAVAADRAATTGEAVQVRFK